MFMLLLQLFFSILSMAVGILICYRIGTHAIQEWHQWWHCTDFFWWFMGLVCGLVFCLVVGLFAVLLTWMGLMGIICTILGHIVGK